MTVLAGSTGFGYALGSSMAGRLADQGGHTPAFAVAVSAGALATILALAAGPNLRNADRAAADHPVPVDRRPEVHVNTRTTAEMLPPNVARNQPVDDAPRE